MFFMQAPSPAGESADVRDDETMGMSQTLIF
jgi:hypothetical protein